MTDRPHPPKELPPIGHRGRSAHLFDGTFPSPTAVLIDGSPQHNVDLMTRYCQSPPGAVGAARQDHDVAEIIRRPLAARAWAITVAPAWQPSLVAGFGVPCLVLRSWGFPGGGHLHLALPADQELEVGELIGVGVLHPGRTFDWWRAFPLVDDEYRVTAVAITEF